LESPAEILTEPPPVFLVGEGQRIEVPAILLETEHPHAPACAGDGRLHLMARDPHWLYVHWDFARDQQSKLNAESSHGHLIVRIYLNSLNSEPAGENHVHPQSRHWFAHVESPGATYYAELGFYAGKEWRRVAVAGPVITPRQRFAFDTSASYRTICFDVPLHDQLEPKRAAEQSNRQGPQGTTESESAMPAGDWSPEQQLAVLRALGVIRVAQTVSGDSGAGEWVQVESAAESVSSAGGGFTPQASGLSDAPPDSLGEFPNPSS
jgi:hypothetical protein